ncbi:trichohyalin-like [Oncorhynchus clarkii lewisi]|uniref:trichohyalin-like n=1 Tax=Oncorhynchus clarkii lewisi TaxID=490388 RepID=UPI0039B91E70
MKFLTEKEGEEAWKDFFDSHLQEKLFEERRWTEKKLSNRKREVESWIVEIQQEWRLREKAQRNMVFKLLIMDLPQRRRVIENLRETDDPASDQVAREVDGEESRTENTGVKKRSDEEGDGRRGRGVEEMNEGCRCCQGDGARGKEKSQSHYQRKEEEKRHQMLVEMQRIRSHEEKRERETFLRNKEREEKKREDEEKTRERAHLARQKMDADRREREVRRMEREIVVKRKEVDHRVISVNRKVFSLRSEAEQIRKERKSLRMFQSKLENLGPNVEVQSRAQNQGLNMEVQSRAQNQVVRMETQSENQEVKRSVKQSADQGRQKCSVSGEEREIEAKPVIEEEKKKSEDEQSGKKTQETKQEKQTSIETELSDWDVDIEEEEIVSAKLKKKKQKELEERQKEEKRVRMEEKKKEEERLRKEEEKKLLEQVSLTVLQESWKKAKAEDRKRSEATKMDAEQQHQRAVFFSDLREEEEEKQQQIMGLEKNRRKEYVVQGGFPVNRTTHTSPGNESAISVSSYEETGSEWERQWEEEKRKEKEEEEEEEKRKRLEDKKREEMAKEREEQKSREAEAKWQARLVPKKKKGVFKSFFNLFVT